jgi:hypothetical protein
LFDQPRDVSKDLLAIAIAVDLPQSAHPGVVIGDRLRLAVEF